MSDKKAKALPWLMIVGAAILLLLAVKFPDAERYFHWLVTFGVLVFAALTYQNLRAEQERQRQDREREREENQPDIQFSKVVFMHDFNSRRPRLDLEMHIYNRGPLDTTIRTADIVIGNQKLRPRQHWNFVAQGRLPNEPFIPARGQGVIHISLTGHVDTLKDYLTEEIAVTLIDTLDRRYTYLKKPSPQGRQP